LRRDQGGEKTVTGGGVEEREKKKTVGTIDTIEEA